MVLKALIAVVVIVFMFFVITGNYFGQQCVDVNGCKECWKPLAESITSDLCPDPQKPCIAQPEARQHNAYVDASLCACQQASADNYQDADINQKIIDAVYGFSGYKYQTAKEFCESPGNVAVKVKYG
ncbi:MAG TPA: hypothetical protein VI968_03630 [archaeon]|nr:hypothetical protein [archaeon]